MIVVGLARIEGHVGREQCICEVEGGCKDAHPDDEAGKNIALGPPGVYQRRASIVDLVPVKGQHTETQPRLHAKDGVDNEIVCGERRKSCMMSVMIGNRQKFNEALFLYTY